MPDEVPPDGLELGVYYSDNARYLWTLFALFVLLMIAVEAVAQPDGPLSAILAVRTLFNLLLVALLGSLALVRRRAYHALLAPLLLVHLLWQMVPPAPRIGFARPCPVGTLVRPAAASFNGHLRNQDVPAVTCQSNEPLTGGPITTEPGGASLAATSAAAPLPFLPTKLYVPVPADGVLERAAPSCCARLWRRCVADPRLGTRRFRENQCYTFGNFNESGCPKEDGERRCATSARLNVGVAWHPRTR